MLVLGIIPARGGSKGVPRKNIRNLGGKPLIEYTIDECKRTGSLTHFVLSTEDDEIASVAQNASCRVVRRPAELAQDDTPSLPVVQHALYTAEQDRGIIYDAVCLLQPTTPFRKAKEIDEAVKMLAESGADSVVSVSQVPDKYHPNWAFMRDESGNLVRFLDGKLESRRQSLTPAYHRNGLIYLTRRETLVENDSLYGDRICSLVMDGGGCINIDTPDDWLCAIRAIQQAAA
ncbi:MAG: acylneuraminate cytidylyltransferase family protein [Planctomycetes bacterium]|nr:acylneuraminate cytidylyltransferase family protein [Planctomycetota bacterium]